MAHDDIHKRDTRWDGYYNMLIAKKEELDAIPEIIGTNYGFLPKDNTPAIIFYSKLPPSKEIAARVDEIIEHAPHFWWPEEI